MGVVISGGYRRRRPVCTILCPDCNVPLEELESKMTPLRPITLYRCGECYEGFQPRAHAYSSEEIEADALSRDGHNMWYSSEDEG